ncbi:MAG: class I SAM-dependent methyltransferase [Pirellulales bacterium]
MQSEYWDQVADSKVFNHPLNLGVFRSLVGLEEQIVDWGCGYGRILAELHGAGYANLLGVDASARMIARAKREHPQLEFRQITDLNEPALSVDAILLFAVLTCIPSDDDQTRLLAECQRLLRPGGLLYVSDLYLNSDARNVARYDRFENQFGVRGVFQLEDGGVMRHHDEDWIRRLFAPFEQLHHEEFIVQTMNNNSSRAFQYFGRRAAG